MANDIDKVVANCPKPGNNVTPEIERAPGTIRDSAFFKGVSETTKIPTYVMDTKYIDPQKVERIIDIMKASKAGSVDILYAQGASNPIIQKAIDDFGQEIKNQMSTQNLPLPKDWNLGNYAHYAIEGLFLGPHASIASQNNTEMCFVTNAPYDPVKMVFAQFPEGFPLKDLPGSRQNYERFIGRHEAGHCNDHATGAGSVSLKALIGEVAADSEAIKKDLANPALAVEAQAFIDLRVLNYVHGTGEFTHATPFFLDDRGNRTNPTENSLKELAFLKDNMVDIVTRGSKMPKDNVETLLKTNPAAFAAILKQQLDADDPQIIGKTITAESKGFMNRYIAAVERRTYDTSPQQPAPTAEPQKISLNDILNPDNPIIYQGKGTHIANALHASGQNIDIQKARESDIGPPMSAQQILAADMTAAPSQKKDYAPQLS